MHLSFCVVAVSTITLIVSSTLAPAKAIATEFEKQTGHKVTFTIRAPFDIDKELAERTFDAVILSVPAMDIHDDAGDLVPISRVALARVGVGGVVQEGGPVPDVSTPEKLKAAVFAAHSLTHTDPAIPNTSGAIASTALAKLGILDEVKEKTRYATLPAGGELVAKGEAVTPFGISERLKKPRSDAPRQISMCLNIFRALRLRSAARPAGEARKSLARTTVRVASGGWDYAVPSHEARYRRERLTRVVT